MSFETNRILSGVGAIFIALGSFFPFLSLVGIVLLLIGMRGLSFFYDRWSIFQNALYGFIFSIVGVIAYIILFLGFFGIFSVVTSVGPGPAPSGPRIFAAGIFILFIVGVFIFYILHAVFYRRAFNILADVSGVSIFRTSGLLLLIGSALTIILVGFVLLFVAWILAAVGFFSMRMRAGELPDNKV